MHRNDVEPIAGLDAEAFGHRLSANGEDIERAQIGPRCRLEKKPRRLDRWVIANCSSDGGSREEGGGRRLYQRQHTIRGGGGVNFNCICNPGTRRPASVPPQTAQTP